MPSNENTTTLKPQEVRAVLKRIGSFFLEGQTAYAVEMGGVRYAAQNYLENPVYFGAAKEDAAEIRKSCKSEEYIIDFIFKHIDELTKISIMVKDPFLVQMIEKQVGMAAPEVKTEIIGEHQLDLTAQAG